MRDYVSVGSAPWDEPCAQLGEADFLRRNKLECAALIKELRHLLSDEPKGASLSTKACQHDFGTYYEVVCYFDDQSEVATQYALNCEALVPDRWTVVGKSYMRELESIREAAARELGVNVEELD